MRKRGTKRILAWVTVLVILLGNVQGIIAADTNEEPKNTAAVEITQADLEMNEYETYYYSTAVLVILLGNVQGIIAADTNEEPKNTAAVEITQADLEMNEYETYYYSTDRTYTYQGDVVNFISETQMQAGDVVYDLKNKAVNISVQQAEEGTLTITLEILVFSRPKKGL